jgi:hypothetical protein
LLGGGLVTAVFNYRKDKRTQTFVERQAKAKMPVEIEGLRITNADQALAMMQRVNESLVEEIGRKNVALAAAEERNARQQHQIVTLEEELSMVRGELSVLTGRCENMQSVIDNLREG